MQVEFYGVRGSCPCSSEAMLRYGGNTACVALTVEGEPPIVFDLGTGLRGFGATQPTDGSFRGVALVTHIHWDHIQGLPFFPPADRHGAELDIYGPEQDGGDLGTVFDDFMRPPYFPVRVSDLRGRIEFHAVHTGELELGHARVLVRPVPHVGPTVGYRVTWQGATVTYISDHQAPVDLEAVDDGVLELAAGADLLVHDAQYTRSEFEEKSHWGHCTTDYALRVAQEAGVGRLAMFHHDPAHDDATIDRLLAETRAMAHGSGVEVVAAYEGLRLIL
ncbi:MAG TPA: MBL fold metallo-hydrolase [Acidimicrobiales bacterium]|nr:MBL fold metallo-hydrolase [Acidimicrobiales bacterium]